MRLVKALGLVCFTVVSIAPQTARAQRSSDPGAYQLSLMTGIGLSDFTGTLGSHTSAGLGWTVRGAYQFIPNVAVEVTYFGARNSLSDPRISDGHTITTTSFTGDLKASTVFTVADNLPIEPYVFAGLGLGFFGVSGPPAVAPGVPGGPLLYDSDSNVVIPLGLGANTIFTPIAVGLRFTYDINIANRISAEGRGNQYGLIATIGLHY